jgi:hypothetical protein
MSYSFNIQKDLPLITWKLDDSGISSGNTIYQDGYLLEFPNSSTSTNGTYRATCTAKSFPIINSSTSYRRRTSAETQSRSIYITQNNATATLGAVQIPAMGFATTRYKADPMTLEFWIKPKTTLSTSTMQKIVGKDSSQTGVYVHNSSFIGIVGDTAGNVTKVVVPVENMSKPFHVAFVYKEDSVSLIVNGIGKTVQFKNNILSTSYVLASDVFRFFHFGLDYALDDIAIYAYAMTTLTARRHMVYGLGYEVPESLAGNFGGYRYNLSLAQSKFAGVIQKYNGSSWMNNTESNNLVIEKDHLRINNFEQPSMKYTEDKTSSVFSWDGTQGLRMDVGGLVEINPQRYGSYVKTSSSDSTPNGSGFAGVFHKTTAQTSPTTGDVKTLMVLQDPINDEYFLKIYILKEASGEGIYYQINNDGGTKIGSTISGGINGSFSVGYFFNSTSNEITIFQQVSGGTGAQTTFENPGLFPIAYSANLRFMSNNIFDEKENIADLTDSEIERFNGGLQKVVQLDTNITSTSSGIYTDANTRINKYTAEFNSTQKRFVVKSTGWIKFKIDAKRLDGVNGIIGPNRVEWGHDSAELTVTATPIGNTVIEPYADYSALDTEYSSYSQLDTDYSSFNQIYQEADDTWFTSETITNRTHIKNIMGKSSGETRALLITMTFNSNDVEENPTTVSYFRLSSLEVEESSGVYTSTITCNGPDVELTFTDSKKDLHLPDYRETPFFWTEEVGGLRVGRTAKINYDLGTTSGDDSTSGLLGLSFFVNIPDSDTRTLFTVTDGTNTRTMTSSGSTITLSGGGTAWVNGSTSNSFTAGVWTHIVVAFNARMIVAESTNVDIVFGHATNKSDFYLDEILTLDGAVGDITLTEVTMINNLYKGAYKLAVDPSGSNEIIFYDSEISNNTEIYQPMSVPTTQTALLVDVDLASRINEPFTGTTGNLTITDPTTNQLLIDGTYIQDGDRVLLKNQSTSSQNGIFIVGFTYGDANNPSKITTLTLTRQTNPSVGSVVYVKDGVTNKGTHWVSTSTHLVWAESPYLKKVDAYTFEGVKEKTDLVAKATITI